MFCSPVAAVTVKQVGQNDWRNPNPLDTMHPEHSGSGLGKRMGSYSKHIGRTGQFPFERQKGARWVTNNIDLFQGRAACELYSDGCKPNRELRYFIAGG